MQSECLKVSKALSFVGNVHEGVCFFAPRVGPAYREGFMGQRTLVLGAYHYCWYDKCRYYDECVRQGRTAEYDRRCPVYEDKPDRNYYCLSNSNVIEIDSYIEGGHYPTYDAFTHKMSGIKKYVGSGVRAAFWDKVAFYNWIQHYLPEPQEDFQYRQWEEVFLRDLPAFEEVLRELRPQVVLVWTDTLREFLDRHCGTLDGMSMMRVQTIEMDSLEAWGYRVRYADEECFVSLWPDYRNFISNVAPLCGVDVTDEIQVTEKVMLALHHCLEMDAGVMDGTLTERVSGIIQDEELIVSLTLLLQSGIGLTDMLGPQKLSMRPELRNGGRVLCNFYYEADGVPVAPLTGLYPVSDGIPALLVLWGRDRAVQYIDLARMLQPSDTVLLYIDEEYGLPLTVMAGIFGVLRNTGAEGLFLMRNSERNELNYKDAFVSSGLLREIFEAENSLLMRLSAESASEVLLHSSGGRTIKKMGADMRWLLPRKYQFNRLTNSHFKKLIKDMSFGRKVAETKLLEKVAVKLYNAYRNDIVKLEKDSKGKEIMNCRGSDPSAVSGLIESILDVCNGNAAGRKRAVTIKDVQELIGSDIKNYSQRKYRENTKK